MRPNARQARDKFKTQSEKMTEKNLLGAQFKRRIVNGKHAREQMKDEKKCQAACGDNSCFEFLRKMKGKVLIKIALLAFFEAFLNSQNRTFNYF